MFDLVSIITPTYNCSKYIERTIKSVQNQTYKNWEMLIVDDCSTDNTIDIITEIMKSDKRIRYYVLENNSGAAVARTKAMQLANGEYIAFLDSDDIWKPNKLESQLLFMKQNNANITCTYYEQIDEDDSKLNKIIKSPKKTSYNRLLLDCPIGNSTVMYNAKTLGKFVVPNIRKRNDDALWLKMLKKEQYIYAIPEILAEYRVRKTSISSNKISLIKYHWKLYREIEQLNIFRSLFHIIMWCVIKILRIK